MVPSAIDAMDNSLNDRDRLGSTARAKERDAAPHLSVGTSRIVGQSSSTTPRRTDTRDAGKRSDDWRRGRLSVIYLPNPITQSGYSQ